MQLRLLTLLLLFILLLAACGSETATLDEPVTVAPSPTVEPAEPTRPAATATVAPSQEPTTAPDAEPTPADAAMPESTPPTPEVDPFTLARQIVEQAPLPAPEGWQVQPCEGSAPVLCVSDGQENVGYAELLLFPLDGYSVDDPIRAAAQELPDPGAAYPAEVQAAAREALTALALEHLDVIEADRAITYPEDTFTPLEIETAQMGPLPAITFGFVHTDGAGEVVERYLYVVAFDRQFIYWFGTQYDPANVTTFVSDAALEQFAPFFRQIAAGLPLYPPAPSEAGRDPGGLARLLTGAAADAVLPFDWRLYACADGPAYCLNDGETKVAWLELGLVPVSSYAENAAPRRAAAELPKPGTLLTGEQEAAMRVALAEMADERLAQEEANRQEYFSDYTGVQIPVSDTHLGPLPAAAFGHTLLDPEGEAYSEWRWVIALDREFVYWFSLPISATLPAEKVVEVEARFHEMALRMPVYDSGLRNRPQLPALVTYPDPVGEFPYDATWTLEAELPESRPAVIVLSKPSQSTPLSADVAAGLAEQYGFDRNLYLRAQPGLEPEVARELGLFAVFDDTRSLSFAGTPYQYSILTGADDATLLPFAEAAPIAEQFLQGLGRLFFPYEMAESDQGEGVLFLQLMDDVPFPVPAYAVQVAGNGQVTGMSIYLQDERVVSYYPILPADMAWAEAKSRPDAPGNSYRIETPVSPAPGGFGLPVEYHNLPGLGEAGDFYTTISVYRALGGTGAPIIQTADFFRVTGDVALLDALAANSDRVVHLWGTVREAAPGVRVLELARWEAVDDMGGLPVFFGVIERDGDETFLVDEANRTNYLLPGAPAELQADDYVAVTGIPGGSEDARELRWQKISVYPRQAEAEPLPESAPIESVTISSVRLVYRLQPASLTGAAENYFIPAWEFAGTADNGAHVTVWVTAIFRDFFAIAGP